MKENRSRIIELFDKNKIKDAYSLFDSQHPLDIYIGTNNEGRKSLAVISFTDRVEAYSSKFIEVKYEKHPDGSLYLYFNLLDNKYSELFYSFCDDVIKKTYSCQKTDGFVPIIERYVAWQAFFKKDNSFLNESEIKGLVGELLFIDRCLIPTYGAERAISAYIGISDEHKDFELGDTWHEVKTIHNGASSVSISSLEQLDSDRVGHLEVIILDEGAQSDESINLNKQVERVEAKLSGEVLREFEDKLLSKGYFRDDYYNSYSYILVSATSYQVANEFPRLSKRTVPNGVTGAKYDLSLVAIKDYKESEWT